MSRQTTSCCPVCKKRISASKVIEGNSVYLSKNCSEHGDFKVLISKDADRFFDKTFSSPGKEVYERQTEKNNGCPDDCGLCPDHKQHLCSVVIEITDKCDMRCPVCYFGCHGKEDITVDEFKKRLATALRTENGVIDVLQISGGEPTLHKDFVKILKYSAEMKINRILVNTNGRTLLIDPETYASIAGLRDKVEIYLQFDGFNEAANIKMRGKDFLSEKLEVIEKLNKDDIKICLAVTVIPENVKETKKIMDFAVKTKNITGVTFQRFTKTGYGERTDQKSLLQEDILQVISDTGYLKYKDIVPLPCSHENCTSISFIFVADGKTYSMGEYIDYAKHQEVIKNRLGFDSAVLIYIRDQLNKGSICSCCSSIVNSFQVVKKFKEFAEGGSSNYKNMKILRIIVKNFMDSNTFDVERAQKCCVGVSVGNDRIVPFCVNNIFGKRLFRND